MTLLKLIKTNAIAKAAAEAAYAADLAHAADSNQAASAAALAMVSSFAGDPFFKWQGQPSPMSKWKDPTPFSFGLDEDVSEETGSASTLVANRN